MVSQFSVIIFRFARFKIPRQASKAANGHAVKIACVAPYSRLGGRPSRPLQKGFISQQRTNLAVDES
jgi:hypothetical protein